MYITRFSSLLFFTSGVHESKRVFAAGGAPTLIISDNGLQFVSNETQLTIVVLNGVKFNLPMALWLGRIECMI